MASQAKIGYGSTFTTGDGNSPEVFLPFAEITTISLPAISIDEVDTSHELPPTSVRTSFPGFVNSGTVKIDMNLLPATMVALFGEINNRPIRNRIITIPDQSGLGTTWLFQAYLISVDSVAAVGDRMTLSASFRVTGGATDSSHFAPHPPVEEIPPFTIGISEIGGPDQIPP